MKISEIVKVLELIQNEHGDLPCIIETELDYVSCDAEVEECSVEDREGYGLSVKFIM